jgi:hypothetical protein
MRRRYEAAKRGSLSRTGRDVRELLTTIKKEVKDV